MVKLTAELLEPLVGGTVHVQLDAGQQIAMTLTKVDPMGQGADDGNGGVIHTAFTLDLTGPPDPVIEALTYPITLPGQDPMHLFISPHGQDEAGTYYNIGFS
ncbi:hypothetical protein [uncultured Tateyamaria sp.]|uniref:DUF6916 family protein n=1 Tax=uncultured Tateyamaria sp. TaxID=455651 RepID=UPI0026259534|nr:hypothetical protein [uncultured Tateyamaria sp.]